MSEPKFTPGPWEISDGYYETRLDVVDPRGKEVAVLRLVPLEPPKTFEANARLIAAAPDMYDALESVLECGSVNDQWWVGKVKDALLKARGEA